MSQIIFESTHTLSGYVPKVPLAENVNLDDLTTGDPDPVFLTLPVGQVGAQSRNGRRYSDTNIRAILDAVNTRKVDGIKGHLRDEERAYRFDIPSLIWVGAVQEADGMVWAKAYVLQSAGDVREYVKIAKKVGKPIGTSIYGTATIDGEEVRDLEIEQIDLAHPSRVGVPITAAVPDVTSEMTTKEADMPETQETPTPAQTNNGHGDTNQTNAIAELQREHRQALATKDALVADKDQQIETLRPKATLLEQVVALLDKPDDVVATIKALQARVSEQQTELAALLETAIEQDVATQVKIESVRPLVVELVRTEAPTTREAVATAVKTVLERESVKVLLRAGVRETMGPNQDRPLNPTDPDDAQQWAIIPGKV